MWILQLAVCYPDLLVDVSLVVPVGMGHSRGNHASFIQLPQSEARRSLVSRLAIRQNQIDADVRRLQLTTPADLRDIRLALLIH